MTTALAFFLLTAASPDLPPVSRDGRFSATAPSGAGPAAFSGQRPAQVLFVEDPGYPVFGPALKPDSAWRGVLDRILEAGQYGWFGPTVHPDENGPDSQAMQAYKLVIWNTYDYWWGAPQGFPAGLTAADQVNLRSYLDSGGRVWLIGQDLIQSGVPAAWLAENLHLASSIPDYWHGPSVRVQERSRPPYIELDLRSDYQANVFWPDALVPDSQAREVLRDVDQDRTAGIAGPPPIFKTAFWTIDGRSPDPAHYWEYVVREMLVLFGLPVVILDAGVDTIALPRVVFENTVWQPRAVVRNLGTDTLTIPVYCRIEPGGFQSQVTVILPPDSARSVLFPDSFLFVHGFYTVKVYSSLSGDMDPHNDTVTALTEATNWLYYDDGVAANAWAWNEEDNGWGVQFPVLSECRADSIAVFIGNDTWPVPGGDTASFRLYSGLAGPESLRWELERAWIQRGHWNVLPLDTSQALFPAGDNIYVFYIQVGDLPMCPGLPYDRFADHPDYMWQLYNDSFSVSLPGGDWLIRCHVRPSYGIEEERRAGPERDWIQAPAILRPGSRVTVFLEQARPVTIALFDIGGRRQYLLEAGILPAGRHQIPLSAEVPAGVYFIVFRAGDRIMGTRKTIAIQ